jgi:tRNA uridine 5-carboxymethylaminomethyl modification enzyme
VLIDDLIVKGTEEPYRMFTSRAENRLFLRADNANERLCQRGYDLGLLGGHKWEAFQAHQDEKKDLLGELEKRSVFHVEQDIRWLDSQKSSPVHDRASYRELLKRPEIRLSSIIDRWNESSRWNPIIVESVEVEEKYKGYLDKENRLNRRIQKAKDLRIPCDMKFSEISGLSREVVELLEKYRPDRLASARKIPGITPAALAVLGIYLKSKKKSPREPTKKELRKKLLQQKTSKGFQEIRNE